MKIRSSFVANSSSSSSVFITTEEEHNRVLGLLTEFEKAVINSLVEKENLGKLKLCLLGELNDYEYNNFDDFDFDDFYKLLTEEEIKKLKENFEYLNDKEYEEDNYDVSDYITTETLYDVIEKYKELNKESVDFCIQ